MARKLNRDTLEQQRSGQRMAPDCHYLSRFNLEPEFTHRKEMEGKIVSFAAYECQGMDLRTKIDDRMHRFQWKAVTQEDRYASTGNPFKSVFDRDEKSDSLVRIGNQILLERDIDVHEAEENRYKGDRTANERVIKEALNPQMGGTAHHIEEYRKRFGVNAQ